MRRIQCNGQEPCIACAAFNVECTFSKPTSGSEWTSKSDEELASYNYEENLRRYGSKHEETMEALDRLTELLVLHKKFAEAESLEVKALLLKTETFGPEHHDTIRSMHRLVQSWKELGRLTEAEELGQKLIVAQGRLRGEGHSETLHSMYEQADTLQQLRKWPQAETLCMILLDKSLNRLGVKDPLTLQTSALLMSVLRKQGKEAEAERARSLLDRSQPFAGGSFLDLFETSGKPRQDSQLFQDDPDDGAAESRMSGRDATWSSGGGSSSRGIGSSDFGTSGLSEAFEHGLRGLGTQRGRRRDDENPAEVFWCRVGDESCPRTIGKRSYDVEMHRDMHEQDCTRRMESRRTASLVPLPANPFAPLQRSATMPARAALERSESGGGDEGDDDERESSLDDGFEAERRQMEEERRQLAVLRAEIARERAELEELRRQRA